MGLTDGGHDDYEYGNGSARSAYDRAIEARKRSPRRAPTCETSDADTFGYERREVIVVRFLDDDESAKWFMRRSEELGRVTHPFDGPAPYNEKELLAFVATNFGPEACAIY